MKYTIMLCCLAFFVSCSPKVYSPLMSNNPDTEEGTIFLNCSGFGKNDKSAFQNSIYNALNTLLFQGVPASIQPTPMIEPADADKARPKVENCIQDNTCYKNFITTMTYENLGNIQNGIYKGVQVNAKIKINMRALRTWLEQNKLVARPFTF